MGQKHRLLLQVINCKKQIKYHNKILSYYINADRNYDFWVQRKGHCYAFDSQFPWVILYQKLLSGHGNAFSSLFQIENLAPLVIVPALLYPKLRPFRLCGRLTSPSAPLDTVNVDIFTLYIFSRRAVHARNFDVSENVDYWGTNRMNSQIRENLMAQNCLQRLNAPKFSSAKISTFTVLKVTS